MAVTVTVQVDGLRQLGEALRSIGRAAPRVANSMTGAGAGVIKKKAIARIDANPSVDEGDLRRAVIVKKIPKSQARYDSEHIVTVRGRGKPKTKKGRVINRAPHASLVEYGTVNMKAEPYMRPAFDQGKGEALQKMIARGRAGIAKARK